MKEQSNWVIFSSKTHSLTSQNSFNFSTSMLRAKCLTWSSQKLGDFPSFIMGNKFRECSMNHLRSGEGSKPVLTFMMETSWDFWLIFLLGFLGRILCLSLSMISGRRSFDPDRSSKMWLVVQFLPTMEITGSTNSLGSTSNCRRETKLRIRTSPLRNITRSSMISRSKIWINQC